MNKDCFDGVLGKICKLSVVEKSGLCYLRVIEGATYCTNFLLVYLLDGGSATLPMSDIHSFSITPIGVEDIRENDYIRFSLVNSKYFKCCLKGVSSKV